MRSDTQHPSRLFLTEIILAILFFSLASAVCLRCFARSHTLSLQATRLNQAVSQTENIAELLRSVPEENRTDADVILHTLQKEYPDLSTESSESSTFSKDSTGNQEQNQLQILLIYFDKNWNPCKQPQAFYQIKIQISPEILDASDPSDASEASIITCHLKASVFSDNANDSGESDIYQLDLKLYGKEA